MENAIQLPEGCSLVALVKKAYELSSPRGLGFLHFKPEPLTDEEAQAIVDRQPAGGYLAVHMDYVKGRSIKLSVLREDGRLWLHDRWYDHSDGDLADLIASTKEVQHG